MDAHQKIDSKTYDRFYLILGTDNPEYPYNVQEYNAMWKRATNTKSYAYCGIGRFCRSYTEAYDWIMKEEQK